MSTNIKVVKNHKKPAQIKRNRFAAEHKGKRAERVTLAIIRPNTGDLTRGYQFALQTKDHLQLLGEIALTDRLNAVKHETTPVEKIAVNALDFPHVLATGWRFCCGNGFEMCRAIRLYGEGAAKVCKSYDAICDKMADLKKAVATANAALIEAATLGGKGDDYRKRVNAKAATAAAAVKAVQAYEPQYSAAKKEYRKRATAAVALLASIDDLRRG